MPRKTLKPVPGVYVGIDSGAGGGLAVIDWRGATAEPMPKTDADLWKWFYDRKTLFRANGPTTIVIEKVTGYHSGEGFKAGSSAMFNFGVGYGMLKMAARAIGLAPIEVPPQKWQKALGIPPKVKHTGQKKVRISRGKNKGQWRLKRVGGEDAKDFKNRLKEFAQRLYPKLDVTLATADALLIATYCQRSSLNR